MEALLNSDIVRESVTLMTFVLQKHHCTILEDWINFFDHRVASLIVHTGPDEAITSYLQRLCNTYGIELQHLGITTPQETTYSEHELLATQFAAVKTDLGCVVRLDTIPFRADGISWQDKAFALMQESNACFLTGTTLPYNADIALSDPDYMLTQRVSNCFLIIKPEIWKTLQVGTEGSPSRYGRFFVEGAAEDYLNQRELWGIRLINQRNIRIFHCHEWSMRLLSIRDDFRKGHKIDSFLTGYQDNLQGPNARYYMQRPKPLLKSIRIFLGRWRQKLYEGSNSQAQ